MLELTKQNSIYQFASGETKWTYVALVYWVMMCGQFVVVHIYAK